MEQPHTEIDAVNKDKSRKDQSDRVLISDAYLTEFAKKFARHTLSEQTAKDQRACLASGSVFLLGWLNLVEIRTLPEIGQHLVVSTKVLTWIAFTLALFYFFRFIGEALIDMDLAKIDDVQREEFIEVARAQSNARFTARIKPLEEGLRKLEVRRAFREEQNRRENEIVGRRVDDLQQRYNQLSNTLRTLPEGDNEARERITQEIIDITHELAKLDEEKMSVLTSIHEEQAPYPEASDETRRLFKQSSDPVKHRAEMVRLDRVFKVLQVKQKRQVLTRWLDIILPCGMMIAVCGCASVSLFLLFFKVF